MNNNKIDMKTDKSNKQTDTTKKQIQQTIKPTSAQAIQDNYFHI